MTDPDDKIRIGENVVKAAGIPFDYDCWFRSGMEEKELKLRAKELFSKDENVSVITLLLSFQGITLNNYLSELMAEGIIDKGERMKYMEQWKRAD